ncbi:MAG: hypothetical protein Salg2KO_08330 [Salibacteraceae bacterium]
MSISLKIFLASSALIVGLNLQGQEEIAPLKYNEALRSQKAPNTTSSRDINRSHFVYKIDTLSLPFFDDFTENKIKKYEAQIGDDNISLRVQADFTVNGELLQKLSFLFEPTYSITKPTNGPLEYEENPPLYITYYDSAGLETDIDTGWTNVITQIDVGAGTITFDTIEAETTIINSFDTLYVVADDNSYWVTPADESNRGGAFINNSFAQNIITQGVATFDGTDALGYPYDLSNETTYGPADTLESKPFLLDSEMDNVYLSFFYQAGGYGNEPEEEDSLVLEFFNVAEEKWSNVWSTAGNLEQTDVWSKRIWIPVEGADYMQPGFKFRFRNYATLSGILDQWHIDYVQLGAERDTMAGDTIADVAFVSSLSSFTGKYTAVPYKHYLQEYEILQEDTIKASIRNLGSQAVNILDLSYEVTNPEGTVVDDFSTLDPNLEAFSLKRYGFLQSTEQVFPELNEEFVEFDIKGWFNISGGNNQRVNDTVRSKQTFYNYYAYDDGTAESAYALRGAGAELALAFNTPVADTLKAIYFNFPRTLNDGAEDLQIVLTVWNDTSSDPIFVADYNSNPRYTNANRFARFELEPPVLVDGDFMIGYQQLQADKLYLGLDRNNNSSGNLYYRVNDRWFPSTFKGSVMMRPDFGNDPLLGEEKITKPKTGYKVFPNPTTGTFKVEAHEELAHISIYTLSGQLIFETTNTGEAIDASVLNNGLYLIQALDHAGQRVFTEKLIISH